MLRTRVIPCLLLENGGLVKTVKFKKPTYIGDPINSVRIYNELEVDELIFLDIKASRGKQSPPFDIIKELASECFMPFSYGGGIQNIEDVKKLFDIGIEKISINTIAHNNPEIISIIANIYGSQSVIVGIDVKKDVFNRSHIYSCDGTKKQKISLVDYVKQVEQYGAGEILLNSITNDGMMAGFDSELIKTVSNAVNIPVIAVGGAGDIYDIKKAKEAGASAIGLGSMAVFQNKNKGILINFPTMNDLTDILEEE